VPVTPHEELAPIASQIGPYLLQEPLGEGATAVVYRAVHAFLEREVALKLMPPEENPAVIDRFLDEARLLSRLSHPGLVRIFDCGVLPQGGAFLAMELLEGEPLSRRLARLGRLPLTELVDIIGQLAGALEVVHDAGLVHRDIKPSNIMLVGDRVKLLDFGVAKRLEARPRTAPGMLLGTPYYMSPEQCRGARHIDRRSDVYALGAVLFQMATGRPPFDKPTLAEVLEAHLVQAPPRLGRPDLPARVAQVVARALAKSPDDRYSCALAMANALAGGSRTAPMDAAPDPARTIPHKAVAAVLPRPTRPMQRVSRRPLLWALLVATLVTCALIVVVAKLAEPPSVAPVIEAKIEAKVEANIEAKIEPEPKVEPRVEVEPKVEPRHHHRPPETRPPEPAPMVSPVPFKRHPELIDPFDDPDVR
jgi:serine/threonine-protein kinase